MDRGHGRQCVTVGVSIGNNACYFVQIVKVDVQFNNKLSTPVSIDDPTLGRLLRLLPGETKSIVGDVRTTYTSTQYSGPETWTSSKGGFAAGNDVNLGEAGNRMSIANAKQLCEKDSTCRGFTFDAGKLRNGSPKLTKGSFTIFFKNLLQHAITPDMENGGWSESWVKYVKQQGLRGKTTRHHPTYSQTFEIDDSDTADGSLIYKTNACPTHNDLAHYDDDVEEENFPGTQSEFLEHRDHQLRNMVQPHVVPAFAAVVSKSASSQSTYLVGSVNFTIRTSTLSPASSSQHQKGRLRKRTTSICQKQRKIVCTAICRILWRR